MHEHPSQSGQGPPSAPPSPPSEGAKDPVCGMTPRPTTPHRTVYKGHEYLFCCARCRERFEQDPERYLAPKPTSVSPPAEPQAAGVPYTCPMHPEVRQLGPGACPKCGMALEPETPIAPATRTEWTCPMHPEVVSDAPGNCPKCGMALEPRTVTLEEPANPELEDMSRRFWFAVALTVPLVILAMGDMLPGRPISAVLAPRTRVLLELLLATPICLYSAFPFYVRAIDSIRHKSPNMFTLIGLGVSIAYGYSAVAALAPGIFPDAFRHHSGEVGVYFEAAAVIVTL